MKIYIFADMEGISGITGTEFVLPTEPRYATGCKYLTADINACVQGCFDAGADEVVVRDGHSTGLNVIWSELDGRAQLVQGATPGKRMYGIEGSDGVILLGYHAMAGTQRAHLEHTFSSRGIQNIWLNGRKVGEFGMDTAIAGDYNIPVIMTSGCDKLCAEAKEFSPEVITCQVKRSISLQGAMLLSADKAHELIRAKTREAIEALKAGKIKPVTFKDVTIRTEYVERYEPAFGLVADRTVEKRGETVEKAFLGQC